MKTYVEKMYNQENLDIQNAIYTLKTMAQKTSVKIKDAILEIDKPFNKTDLFYYLKTYYNIDNQRLTCEVLDDLCENGILKYVEINDNCWAFIKSAQEINM